MIDKYIPLYKLRTVNNEGVEKMRRIYIRGIIGHDLAGWQPL